MEQLDFHGADLFTSLGDEREKLVGKWVGKWIGISAPWSIWDSDSYHYWFSGMIYKFDHALSQVLIGFTRDKHPYLVPDRFIVVIHITRGHQSQLMIDEQLVLVVIINDESLVIDEWSINDKWSLGLVTNEPLSVDWQSRLVAAHCEFASQGHRHVAASEPLSKTI